MKIFILCILVLSVFSQTYFELKSGKEFKGYILESTNEEIKIQLFNDRVINLRRPYIKDTKPISVYVQTINGLYQKVHIYKLTEDSVYCKDENGEDLIIERSNLMVLPTKSANSDQSYWLAGFSLLYPGVINTIFGGHFSEKYGLRGHFGLLPKMQIYGAQVDCLYNLQKDKHFEQNLALIGGIIFDGKNTSTYIGPAYDLNVWGLHLQLGMRLNFEEDDLVIANIGYVYRFNR